MKLVFRNINTACIYAPDDPAYIAHAEPVEYPLTPQQERMRRRFERVMALAKATGYSGDVGRLLDAVRDYERERREAAI